MSPHTGTAEFVADHWPVSEGAELFFDDAERGLGDTAGDTAAVDTAVDTAAGAAAGTAVDTAVGAVVTGEEGKEGIGGIGGNDAAAAAAAGPAKEGAGRNPLFEAANGAVSKWKGVRCYSTVI